MTVSITPLRPSPASAVHQSRRMRRRADRAAVRHRLTGQGWMLRTSPSGTPTYTHPEVASPEQAAALLRSSGIDPDGFRIEEVLEIDRPDNPEDLRRTFDDLQRRGLLPAGTKVHVNVGEDKVIRVRHLDSLPI